jgi:hypothetical protein
VFSFARRGASPGRAIFNYSAMLSAISFQRFGHQREAEKPKAES